MRRIAPLMCILSEEDGDRAYRAAVGRNTRALREGHKDKHGYCGDGLAIHIPGCQGELAWHKRLGLVWDETDTFKKPDWGWYCQIRCAPCKAPRPPIGFGTLIFRPGPGNDDPRDWFTLVAGRFPYFVLLGWIEGEKIPEVGEWKPEAGRDWAWWVHNSLLNKDLDELLER